MTELGRRDGGLTRRRALGALTAGSAAAWAAPQIVATSHAGAATIYMVTYDANCNLTAGGPVPFTVTCDADMTNGGPITMDTPGCTFLSGTGSGFCFGASPPGPLSPPEPGIVSGGGSVITFPDLTVPENCLYSSVDLTVSCVS